MTNSRKVLIVTDSTSDIPAHLSSELEIEIVPLSINFENETLLDGVDITAEDYVARLRTLEKLPSTAQPTVEQFQAAYRKGLEAGLDVVCLCVSTGLSGTFNSASLAAKQMESDRIRVIDSQSACMALGWLAIEVARLAQGGASTEEVVAAAERIRHKVHFFAVLPSLEYVFKGGRIGRASHMVGSALGIKPILGLDEGVVHPVERVRTWKKALNRMIEVAAAEGTLLDVSIVHTDNIEDARHIMEIMKSRFPDANYELGYAGPTVATYAGPGAVGIMTRTA